jgi:hypothetical protein
MANLSTKIKLYVNQEVDFSKEVIYMERGTSSLKKYMTMV